MFRRIFNVSPCSAELSNNYLQLILHAFHMFSPFKKRKNALRVQAILLVTIPARRINMLLSKYK